MPGSRMQSTTLSCTQLPLVGTGRSPSQLMLAVCTHHCPVLPGKAVGGIGRNGRVSGQVEGWEGDRMREEDSIATATDLPLPSEDAAHACLVVELGPAMWSHCIIMLYVYIFQSSNVMLQDVVPIHVLRSLEIANR